MKDNTNILKHNISEGIKWSTTTEIIAKLIVPINNMILARIIAPEAFGIITTITMITSFTDIFTNSGFQKFLIQNEFKDDNELLNYTTVAFWANLILSIILWLIIILFSEEIAILLASSELKLCIIISCIQIPITSFSSIQIAIHRRNFNFKTLFIVRIITSIIPLIITIPLAIANFSYWSIIIGNIIGSIVSALIMTIQSEWKPNFFFDINLLKKMFKYTSWTTIDSIGLWLTTWIDAFIIGTLLNDYYIGLYKVSLNSVNSIYSIITSSVTPVFFSAISRVQNDNYKISNMYLKTQKIVAYLVFPIGILIFLYSDLVVKILLGKQWIKASNIIGIWGLMSAIMIVLSNFNSDIFKAKGKPETSFFLQMIHAIIVSIACVVSIKYGFWALVYTRAFIRLTDPLISCYFINKQIGIGYRDIFTNIRKPMICTIFIAIIMYILKLTVDIYILNYISILLVIPFYFIAIFIVSKDDFRNLINILTSKFNLNNKLVKKWRNQTNV